MKNYTKELESSYGFNKKDAKKCSKLINKTKAWWHQDNYCNKCDEYYEVCEYLGKCKENK